VLSCGEKQRENAGSSGRYNLASELAKLDSVTIVLTGEDSVSVFELLKRLHRVDSWSTAVGVFVNGIDTLKNGPRVFWVFSVNDTMPEIASDKRITKNGDRVVWHFRRLE
jgi:hypothetical protein